MSRLIGLADTAAHKLHLPRWLRWWLCDLYDLSLDATRDELRRKA